MHSDWSLDSSGQKGNKTQMGNDLSDLPKSLLARKKPPPLPTTTSSQMNVVCIIILQQIFLAITGHSTTYLEGIVWSPSVFCSVAVLWLVGDAGCPCKAFHTDIIFYILIG